MIDGDIVAISFQNKTCDNTCQKSIEFRPTDYLCYLWFRNVNCAN